MILFAFLFGPAVALPQTGLEFAPAPAGACVAPLPDGRVLIAGGAGPDSAVAAANIYGADGLRAAAPMLYARADQACAALPGGRILVAGGRLRGAVSNSVEIYDAAADSWTIAASMPVARAGATASALPDGRVLIAGGESPDGATATLEVFDPASNSFEVLETKLATPRQGHAAAALRDGRILIAGGRSGSAVLDTAEVYDPATGDVQYAGKMARARTGHSATRLLDGMILIAGGSDGNAGLDTAEIFDGATGEFTAAASMPLARSGHLAFTLPGNNQVMIAGGAPAGSAPLVYVPWRDVFEASARLLIPRAAGAAKRDGRNLASGATAADAYPTIRTSKLDYAPGEWVQITGTNWTPGATVNLQVTVVPEGTLRWEASVQADAQGNVSAGFQVTLSDLNKTFALTATEAGTGRQAQVWTFTDAAAHAMIVVTPAQASGAPVTVSYYNPGDQFKTASGPTPMALDVRPGSTITVTSASPYNGYVYAGTLPATGTAGDAGSTVTITLPYKLPDATPPVITPNISGTQGSNGWYRSDVTVSWTVADPESGIASSSGCGTTSLTSETAGTTLTCSATNGAGLTNSVSVTIKIDKTAPVVTASATAGGSPYVSGAWTNNSVVVTFACTDSGGSGAGTVTGPVTLSSEGAAQSASGTCTDAAGNSATATFSGINIDKTAPSVTGSRTPAANAAGWNNTDVTVTFACTDSLSGVRTAPLSPQVVTAEGSGQSRTGTCTDNAGNTASADVGGINIDKTAPVITLTGRTAANGAGWNNGNVTVSWSCTDALSGAVDATVSQTLTAEVANQTATGNCADKAGNTASNTQTGINIDKTAPVVTGSRTPAANPAGWNNTDVTVTFACTDALSGVGTAPLSPQVVTGEGSGQSRTGTCTDNAGNTASADVSGIKIDKTAPVITLTGRTAANGAGWNNGNVTVSWSCTDALSGAVNATLTQTLTAEGANQSATGNCADNAGNTATDTQTGINIDKTAPVVTGSRTPAANSAGWNNTDVTVTFACTDALSGVGTAPLSPQVVTGEGSGQSRTGTCTDNAGNAASADVGGINIDKTAPGITFTSRTQANGAGWNKADVAVEWSCSDALSGPVSGTVSQTLTVEGANQSAIGTCTDKAGNTASNTQTGINIDKTAPVLTGNRSPLANAAGWNNADVTVTFACSDALSGVAAGGPITPQTVSAEGMNQSRSATCTDKAGNEATTTVGGINIDKTAPNAPIPSVTPGPNAAGWNNTPVTVTFSSADDAGAVQSGVAQCTVPAALSAETAGTQVAGSCTDFAGNTSAVVTVTVKIDTTPPPAPGQLAADPAPVNSSGTISATATDGLSGVASAQYRIGTAYTPMTAADGSYGGLSENVTGTFSYPAPGVYEFCVRATDTAGNTGAESCALLAVYDPGAGFVTGGGWIQSPPGAWAADPSLAGKANFGFVSKYQKGADTPTGQTEFQFKVAGLNFRSVAYEWLVVAGARAQYKGSGTINGAGDYGFLLTAIDGDLNGGGGADRFRIKIVDKTSGATVYDNQMLQPETGDAATAIGGGSIVIHTGK